MPTIMTTPDTNERPVEPDLRLISQAVSITCGKWRVYIILVLGEQTLRYRQLSEQLPGIGEKELASKLKALVAQGIL